MALVQGTIAIMTVGSTINGIARALEGTDAGSAVITSISAGTVGTAGTISSGAISTISVATNINRKGTVQGKGINLAMNGSSKKKENDSAPEEPHSGSGVIPSISPETPRTTGHNSAG